MLEKILSPHIAMKDANDKEREQWKEGKEKRVLNPNFYFVPLKNIIASLQFQSSKCKFFKDCSEVCLDYDILKFQWCVNIIL